MKSKLKKKKKKKKHIENKYISKHFFLDFFFCLPLLRAGNKHLSYSEIIVIILDGSTEYIAGMGSKFSKSVKTAVLMSAIAFHRSDDLHSSHTYATYIKVARKFF